jgi:Tfp pilus assembly protein PilN
MQIQVNLLPGGKKKAKSAKGASLNLGAAFSGLGDKIKDPWLLGAAAAVVVSVSAVGLLFVTQQADATEIERRLDKAVRDSTRLTNVLEARRKVTAERDSVIRQVQIIRTIDDNRYVWAHLLDEISSALPQYTWLVSVEQTSKPTLPPGAQPAEPTTAKGGAAARAEAKAAGTPAGKAAAAKAAAAPQDSIVIHQPVAFRVIGQTVDMQALTQFMKDLEASPFVKNVMLMKSEIVVVDTKDITQFSIEAEFEVAPKELLTTEALVVPVR